MMQRDYLLREIEKIGQLINAIRKKVFGGNDSLSTSIIQQTQDTKEMLFDGLNFDLDKFLTLDTPATIDYLDTFAGFSMANIESLAALIAELGFEASSGNSQRYLAKALQLYELCNIKSNTYSINREMSILRINDFLEKME